MKLAPTIYKHLNRQSKRPGSTMEHLDKWSSHLNELSRHPDRMSNQLTLHLDNQTAVYKV